MNDKDGLTHEEIKIACRNMGINLDCGGCASAFYTGYGGDPHDENCTGGLKTLRYGSRPVRNFAAVIHYVSMALQFMLDDPDIMTIKAKPLALKAINLSGDTIDYQTTMEIATQITGRIRRLEMLK